MKNVLKLTIGLAVVAALGFTLVGMNPIKAQMTTEIGFIDQEFIVEAYAGPQLAAVIYQEERLQAEFDRESASMSNEEKQQLFSKYQEQLAEFEKEIGLQALFEDIEAAIRASAEAHGVTVVLDHHAVVLGGVDLTVDVLQRLGLLQESP